MSIETITKRLPKEYKFLILDIDEIKAGINRANTKEGYQAWDLYHAGLECNYGTLNLPWGDLDQVPAALGNKFVRGQINALEAAGVPVYLGPSAIAAAGQLVVHASDSTSLSLGLWTPRPGESVDHESINYIRLTPPTQ